MFASTSESEILTETFIASLDAKKLCITDFSFKVLEQKKWPIDTEALGSSPQEVEEEAKNNRQASRQSSKGAAEANKKDSSGG